MGIASFAMAEASDETMVVAGDIHVHHRSRDRTDEEAIAAFVITLVIMAIDATMAAVCRRKAKQRKKPKRHVPDAGTPRLGERDAIDATPRGSEGSETLPMNPSSVVTYRTATTIVGCREGLWILIRWSDPSENLSIRS